MLVVLGCDVGLEVTGVDERVVTVVVEMLGSDVRSVREVLCGWLRVGCEGGASI